MSASPDTAETTPRQILVKAPAGNSSDPTANPAPSASAYPPQSAAYPAMPPAMLSRDASSQSSASASVASPTCKSKTEKQVATGSEPSPQSSSSDDTVIAGQKGSASGTIALPSTQTTVPWPAVPGAPPGYPGDWHKLHANPAPHVAVATCCAHYICS